MSDRKKITLIKNDSYIEVEIISMFRIKDKEYVVYCVDKTDDLCDVYVARVGKDTLGNDMIFSIDNDIERKNLNACVDKILKRSRVI